jgi:hypothetical protein
MAGAPGAAADERAARTPSGVLLYGKRINRPSLFERIQD